MNRIIRMSPAVAVAVALGLVPCGSASAAVSLVLAANPAAHSGKSVSVTRGSPFQVAVQLISTTANSTDSVQGISYQFQASGPAVGVFKLLSRDSTSAASGADQTDPWDNYNTPDSTAFSASAATLNPSNGTPGSQPFDGDLGALLRSSTGFVSNNYPNGTGTFNPSEVANYSILVASNAAIGAYTITVQPTGTYTTFSPPSNFGDAAWSTPPAGAPIQNTFTVNVVPEPSSALMLCLGSGALGLRRRRR